MSKVEYLTSAGLTVQAIGDTLRLSPSELITDEQRQYVRTHKAELLYELNIVATTSSPAPQSVWLSLLVLDNGVVIQQTGRASMTAIKSAALIRFGDALLAVVSVPGFERPLTEVEIIKALSGTLGQPAPASAPSSLWLARVARILGTTTTDLLSNGHIDQHDIAEMAGTDPVAVAKLIRSSPAWINRISAIEEAKQRFSTEQRESAHHLQTHMEPSA